MAVFKKSVLQRLCLFLLASYTFAAPIIKDDEASLDKRTPPLGSNANPYHVYFDISGWQDIAEEDCRIALCELGGITL